MALQIMSAEQAEQLAIEAKQKLIDFQAERENLPQAIAELKAGITQGRLDPAIALKGIAELEARRQVVEFEASRAQGDLLRAAIAEERRAIPPIEAALEEALEDERLRIEEMNQAQAEAEEARRQVLKCRHDLEDLRRKIEGKEIQLSTIQREAAARLAA